jgi:hypothetical protein
MKPVTRVLSPTTFLRKRKAQDAAHNHDINNVPPKEEGAAMVELGLQFRGEMSNIGQEGGETKLEESKVR